jgi:hypothetical protein
MFFYAIDGDDVGRRLEQVLLSGSLDEIQTYCKNVNDHLIVLEGKLRQHGCHIVFASGDSILAYSDSMLNIDLLPLLASNGLTFSVGVGRSVPGAWLALKRAKALGRNRVELMLETPV